MPTETLQAVEWALQQKVTDVWGCEISVTQEKTVILVDKVREYFNAHGIAYETFSYDSLIPFLS